MKPMATSILIVLLNSMLLGQGNTPLPVVSFTAPRQAASPRHLHISIEIRHPPKGPLLLRVVGFDTVRYARIDPELPRFVKQAASGRYRSGSLHFPWQPGKHRVEVLLFRASDSDRGDPVGRASHEVTVLKAKAVSATEVDDIRFDLAKLPMHLKHTERLLRLARQGVATSDRQAVLDKLQRQWQIARVQDFHGRMASITRLAEAYADACQPELALACYRLCTQIYSRERKSVYAGLSGKALLYASSPPSFLRQLARFSTQYGHLKEAIGWHDEYIRRLRDKVKLPGTRANQQRSTQANIARRLRASAEVYMQLANDVKNYRARIDQALAIERSLGR